SGVLFRRTRTIPYGRIQGINTAQSPMQRVLGLGSLRVDTGQQGVEAEAELPMLRWSDVLALQEELVRRRGPVVGGGGEAVPADGGASVVRPAPSGTVLATVSD
ncbi:MAG: PH domain-containing protein, partial [Phycisphaerae bacterium]